MASYDETSRKRVPLCISIDTPPQPVKPVRRRAGTRRRALSLAAVHEPPDKLKAPGAPGEKFQHTATPCVKASAFSGGALHNRRRRDRKH